MADLIRGFDWSQGPLGPIQTWSDTLVTTVNLLLASRHPMFLWWGPDLIQFYNDGYRPSIRSDKHPSAVGLRGVECWPEVWSIIGPQIEAVMTQGHSSWNKNQLVPINRNGKLEEVYWTYGYSPVRDQHGNVQGTLVVCSDTTEQVLSERRLRTLLSITLDSPTEHNFPPSDPMLQFVQSVLRDLGNCPADTPFASFCVLNQGRIAHFGSTESSGPLADPGTWPLEDVVSSQSPVLLQDLQERCGNLICQPWPEPVICAHVLPLSVAGSSIQAVLISGISPRLPFDANYETFFRLVGNRIAGLLQSEVHKLDLDKAAKRFSSLAEANPFGMMIGDLRGKLTYVNPAFLHTLGYSEADVNSGLVRWDNLTPREYSEADARAVEQLRSSGRCDVYEKAYVTKDVTRIPILIGAAVIDGSVGDPEVAAFVTDLTPLKTAEESLRKANEDLEKKIAERTAALEVEISDRKRAEISLRELTGRLLVAQDEERRHMARELHDHAGQTLAVLAMNLSTLRRAAKDQDSYLRKLAAESQQLSEDLSTEIRTLSYLLHPPLLDEIGLASALRWYVDGFSERSKIKVDIDLPEDMARLPKELELVIFRVVQEGLTNVHRHSGSSTARLYLVCSEGRVQLEISDQGKGIPRERHLEMMAAKAGVGIRGMEERVRQFGGSFQISSDSNGTKVSVTLPVRALPPGN